MAAGFRERYQQESRREGPETAKVAQQDSDWSDSKIPESRKDCPCGTALAQRAIEKRGNPGNRLMINSLLRIAGVYKAYEKYLIEQIKYGPCHRHRNNSGR